MHEFIDWMNTVERVFEYKDVLNDKKVNLVALKLCKYASIWWSNVLSFYGGLCSLNVDDMWDLFESLASYQCQCECTSEYLMYPYPPRYDLHTQSPCVD